MINAARVARGLRLAIQGVPIDVIAFIAIAVAIVMTHVPVVRYGVCFDDPSALFHFGQRVLAGDVPYRDFVVPTGPLPIYVDAAAQWLGGGALLDSVYAGIALKVLRVCVVWAIARRVAGPRPAVGVAVLCGLDPVFAHAHHTTAAYAELLLTLAGLWFVLATSATGRAVIAYLVLAGASVGLVAAAEPTTAATAGVALLATTTSLAVWREWFSPRRLVALWAGYAAACAVLLIVLGALGALGPALDQLVASAPDRHGARGLAAVADALSGGALVADGYSWWGGALAFLALPAALVIAALGMLAGERSVPVRTLALIAPPLALLCGLLARHAEVDWLLDVPRMFLLATCVLLVASPRRVRRWLGVEPLAAVGLAALPLAADWSGELTRLGRGTGDLAAVITGALLVTLASSRLGRRPKLRLGIALAVVAVAHALVVVVDRNPFGRDGAGGFDDNAFTLHRRGEPPAMLGGGLQIDEPAARALGWVAAQIEPGSTCFIAGELPALYDLVGCTNPTRLDSTAPAFATAVDTADALVALRVRPPEYYIVVEPVPPGALGDGVRAALVRYESIGAAADQLAPELARRIARRCDGLGRIRLYRRRPW